MESASKTEFKTDSEISSVNSCTTQNVIQNSMTSRPGTPMMTLDSVSYVDLENANQKCSSNARALQHLYQHASIYGVDSQMNTCGESPREMSQQNGNVLSPAFLSWRKLHLSKAKLKAASNTSALLAGFAMIALVEIQLQQTGGPQSTNGQEQFLENATKNTADQQTRGGPLPEPLLILFAVCTTLLVAVHMLALLISTCILPNMEAIANLQVPSLVHESPHEKMQFYIELAWGCSTVLGILLFMIEIIVLCWLQFYNVCRPAAYVATCVLVPFIILFIMFAFTFYRKLVTHTYETRKTDIEELVMLNERLGTGDIHLVNSKPSDNFMV